MVRLSQKVAAIREEILRTLPPSQIKDEQFRIAVWHLRAPFEDDRNEIVDLARAGDVDARAAIQTVLSEHFADGLSLCDLPDALALYIQDQVTGKLSPTRGRPQLRNWPRDFWIFAAMWICKQRGLKPTRTAVKRKGGAIESGSQLVESILKEAGIKSVGVSQIEKIYSLRRARRPQMTR